MEKREIEITRNVIERALMAVKDYINTHMKEFVIGCVSALGLAVLITVESLYTTPTRTPAW